MQIKPFALERYFAKYEFSTKYLLSSSDCDGLELKYVLGLADPQAISMYENLRLGYTDSAGLPLLRAEIAKLYEGVDESDVLVVVPEEGIFITMNSILRKGDHVICTFPGYQSLYEIADSLGAEITKWEPDVEQGFKFNVEDLKKSIKPNTKLIVINFPHNPTGSMIKRADLMQIIEIAKQKNIYLFSDEMYRFLELNPSDRLPAAVELYERAISLFGMSKTFGMAGVRIGWIITKDKKLFQDLANFRDYTTICNSAPSEILSLIALRAKDTIIQKHVTRIKNNLDLLDVFFDKHKNFFSWSRPIAGTIAFPQLLTGESSFDFCERVIRDAGVMLLPSSVYDFGNSHFRIGFGRTDMPETLKAFENYIEKNRPK